MHQLFILYEHASGYALFRTSEFEEIGGFLPQVRRSVQDLGKFRSIVNFLAYQKFKNMHEALDNLTSIAKGQLHRDLQLFLESNVPKSKKSKQSVALGVQDSDLAAAISDTLGMNCKCSQIVSEITRGIRSHFHKMVRGFADAQTAIKTQLGLSHHFARAKLNVTADKFDNIVIQNANMIEQLEKDINKFALRVIHWYSLHFPELIKIVPHIPHYVECIGVIKNRKNMPENVEDELQNILLDTSKVKSIIEASNNTMGMDIAEEDMENIEHFIDQITSLTKRKDEMNDYLTTKMRRIAPNLSSLIGEKVGAQLISQAGGLLGLAKLPSSTIQVLGAEKSLFRIMKAKTRSSKFLKLSQKSSVGKASTNASGHVARFLANKCSLASKIDCFCANPTDVHGKELKQLVNERIKFYETGKFASKEVIEERLQAVAAKKALILKRRRENKKRKLASLKKPEISSSKKSAKKTKRKKM